MKLALASAICLLLAPCQPAHCDAGRDPELRKLQGTWTWDPAHPQMNHSLPKFEYVKMIVEGETLTLHYVLGDQNIAVKMKLSLNPKANPKEIDLTPLEGANKGKAYPGLYELAGSTIRLGYRGPGEARPKDFNAKDVANMLTTFLYFKANRKES